MHARPRNYSSEQDSHNFLPRWCQWLKKKNPPANVGDARDAGSIPGLGRSLGVGTGNPLQYFCLRNPMDRGIWQATVHGVIQSWT